MIEKRDILEYFTKSIFHLGTEIDGYKKLSFQYLNDANKMVIGISTGAIVLILNTQVEQIEQSWLLKITTFLFLITAIIGFAKNRLISKFYFTSSQYLGNYLQKIIEKSAAFLRDEDINSNELEKIAHSIDLNEQGFYRIIRRSKLYDFIQNTTFIGGIICMSIYLL